MPSTPARLETVSESLPVSTPAYLVIGDCKREVKHDDVCGSAVRCMSNWTSATSPS